MRSHLFGENIAADSGDAGMTLQNPRMVRYRVDGEFFARQGAMVAYQGNVDFSYQGSGSVGKFLKKALTGEGVPLMRVAGRGDVYLAQNAEEIHLVDLEGDGLTVNGRSVLAFDPTLRWDVQRVQGVGMIGGGLFNTVFEGHGRLAITARGTPVVLAAAAAPTFVDVQALVAWSTSLQTTVRRTMTAGALIGRGSGEAFQLGFAGQGLVIVQASESVTPTTSP